MIIKRKFDITNEAVKRACIDAIITSVEEHTGELIGVIAAEEILGIATESAGPSIYKTALDDTKSLIRQHNVDLEIGIDML